MKKTKKGIFVSCQAFLYRLVVMAMIVVMSSCHSKRPRIGCGENYFKLAIMEASHGHERGYRQALVYCQQAYALEPRAIYYALEGSIYFKIGAYQAAEQSLTRALDSNPEEHIRAEILNNRACLYAAAENYDGAHRLWDELIRDPHYVTPEVAWFNKGKAYAAQGFFDRARQAIDRAIACAPDYTDAHLYAGILALQVGDHVRCDEERSILQFLSHGQDGARLFSTVQKHLHT